MNEELYQSPMLTSSTNITVDGFGKCGLKFLVVGGGGDENGADGGAGSGYLLTALSLRSMRKLDNRSNLRY